MLTYLGVVVWLS